MTSRGIGMLLAGLASGFVSRLFGTAALMPVAVALLLCPLLAVVWVHIATRGPAPTCLLTPTRIAAGDAATLSINLNGKANRWLAQSLAWRVVLPSLPMVKAHLSRGVRLVNVGRGEHLLSPITIQTSDPFGLARRSRIADPKRLALLAYPVPFGNGASDAHGRAHRAGNLGAGTSVGAIELLGTRDYQPGDRLNRISWPQSAKRGRLQTMELTGEDNAQTEETIILGTGTETHEGTAFELAVTAAATLAVQVSASGRGSALVLGSDRISAASHSSELALDGLARVLAGGSTMPSKALVAELHRSRPPQSVVIVLSGLDPDLPAAIAQAVERRCGVRVLLVGGAAVSGGRELERSGCQVVAAASRDALPAALIALRNPNAD